MRILMEDKVDSIPDFRPRVRNMPEEVQEKIEYARNELKMSDAAIAMAALMRWTPSGYIPRDK